MNMKIVGMPIIRVLVVSAGILVMILASVSPSFAGTKWNVEVSGSDDGINGFHLSIGEYYRVPHREVVVIHQRGIRHEELPVVFFIAKRARVHSDAVARLRLKGMTWMEISLHYGLSPDIYLVPGYSGDRQHHHGLKHRRLSDHDIVNQVNMIFLSGHHRCAPDRIVKYRSQGRSYVVIDRDFPRDRHEPRRDDKALQQKHKKDRDDRSGRRAHRDNDWKNGSKDKNDRPGNHGNRGSKGKQGNNGNRETHRVKTKIFARTN